MTDVEMKDASKPTEEDKKEEEPTDCFYGKCPLSISTDFALLRIEVKKSLVILEKAGKEKDFKTCAQLTK